MAGESVDVDPVYGGAISAQLLCSPVSWIRRRRLHVSFVDDTAVRFRFSVDFRVPPNLDPSEGAQKTAHVPLPLFVIRKAPEELMDFDLVDERGRARSLPTRESNAALSHQALLARAGAVLGVPHADVASMPGFPEDEIRAIAVGDEPLESAKRCEALLADPGVEGDPVREALANDDDFKFLAELLAGASIISLPIPPSSREQLIKLTYSEPIAEWTQSWDRKIRAGLAPLTTLIELPCVGAQTFHLEADMPEGLAVARGVIGVTAPDGTKKKESKSHGRAAHLYLPQVERARLGAAFLGLGLQRAGFMAHALVACAAVAGILVVSLAAAPELASANTTVPTLMLFFPGLLATIVLQPTSHGLTRRMLREARRAVFLCAGLAYLAAMWLVVAPSVPAGARSASGQPALSRSSAVSQAGPSASGRPGTLGRRPLGRIAASLSDGRPAAQYSERPSAGSLRVGWGLLALPAIAVTIWMGIAYRRALP